MKTIWKNYLDTMQKELGSEVAKTFVESLVLASHSSEEYAIHFFYRLGRTWAPVIASWAIWIKNRAAHESIALILRDAKPLQEIPNTHSWKKLYLNRQNCGIPDELSGDVSILCHPLLKQYLKENSCENDFTFIDSGCYGTVVLELHKLGIKFQPLFFFSKNPNIPGFLNELGFSEKEGEILNDSLECAFPNIYCRPSEMILNERGRVVVPLTSADELSVLFGREALRGVCDESRLYHSCYNETQCVKNLLSLSAQAKNGIFTGILATASPEWSGKKDFLEHWPKHLSWI
ncbi:MAG: hypothetical protein WC897_06255 [Candidatus Gracilibacteria bacterium]